MDLHLPEQTSKLKASEAGQESLKTVKHTSVDSIVGLEKLGRTAAEKVHIQIDNRVIWDQEIWDALGILRDFVLSMIG